MGQLLLHCIKIKFASRELDRTPRTIRITVGQKGFLVLWAVAISACTGLLLGLSLGVPAVIAASLATVVACIVLAPLANWSLLQTAIHSLALLTTLQTGYLLGLMLSCARSRLRSWPARASRRKVSNGVSESNPLRSGRIVSEYIHDLEVIGLVRRGVR